MKLTDFMNPLTFDRLKASISFDQVTDDRIWEAVSAEVERMPLRCVHMGLLGCRSATLDQTTEYFTKRFAELV